MIHKNTNGTYFYECDTCWWVSPDYMVKEAAILQQQIHEPYHTPAEATD